MTTRTITGTIKVQIGKYTSLDDLKADDAKLFGALVFMETDMGEHGYSVVGEAAVTVTLNSIDKVCADKVDALRAEVKRVQADAQRTVTGLTRKISELLAITNEVSA